MLPGPVFNVELVTTARRRRYFAIRVVYGLILLWIIWQGYRSLAGWQDAASDREYSNNQLAAFARGTFRSFTILQLVAVLALTPALVAGVIADENRRKTLHYLLASRLTGAEIVLGKLAARLLHVGVFLAVGLPVLAGLTLFGGIDPRDVLLMEAGSATSAFFLAGLSILVSTVTRRARDAILATYLLELVWLGVPPLLEAWLSFAYPAVHAFLGTALGWALAMNPVAKLDLWLNGGVGTGPVVAWMCGLQVAAGTAAVALAVLRLRAGFRDEGAERQGIVARIITGRRRLFARPACGDHPMLWKECHVARFSGVVRVVVQLVGLLMLLGLGYATARLAANAFTEVFTYGYGMTGPRPDRSTFNAFLRFLGVTGLALVSMVGAAATAAGGVTGEKEGDTWTSLTATDLDGAEILRAKMIGAAWTMRWPLGAMAILGLLGVAAGAVHPFGFLSVAVESAAFLWFAAALGTTYSLHLKTTTKALAATIATLFVLNGGYLLCCIPTGAVDTPLVAVGCTPLALVLSLLSYADLSALVGTTADSNILLHRSGELVALCILSTLLYAGMAAALTASSIQGFDRLIDRPDRSKQVRPQGRSKPQAPRSRTSSPS